MNKIGLELHQTNKGLLAYNSGSKKRLGGQTDKDGKWLVLTESTMNSNTSWNHNCGAIIECVTIRRTVWSNKRPICAFCGYKSNIDLPNDIWLCPNCFGFRTGEPISSEETEAPYCPNCEDKPISILDNLKDTILFAEEQ